MLKPEWHSQRSRMMRQLQHKYTNIQLQYLTHTHTYKIFLYTPKWKLVDEWILASLQNLSIQRTIYKSRHHYIIKVFNPRRVTTLITTTTAAAEFCIYQIWHATWNVQRSPHIYHKDIHLHPNIYNNTYVCASLNITTKLVLVFLDDIERLTTRTHWKLKKKAP